MPRAMPCESVDSAVAPTMADRTTMPATRRTAPAADCRAVTTLGGGRTARRPAGDRRAAGITSSATKRKTTGTTSVSTEASPGLMCRAGSRRSTA